MSDDYEVDCVRHICTPLLHDGSPDKPLPQLTTWCGEVHPMNVACFGGLDHAAQNGLDGGRLLACKACVEAASNAMLQTGVMEMI